MVIQSLVDMLGQAVHRLLSLLAIQRVHRLHDIGDRFRVDAAATIDLAPDETRNVEDDHHGEKNERHPLVVRTRREWFDASRLGCSSTNIRSGRTSFRLGRGFSKGR